MLRPAESCVVPDSMRQSARTTFRPVQRDERFANYDRSMQEFMQEHRVPGASIAVTDRGRVVFARGYGYADVATSEPVDPEQSVSHRQHLQADHRGRDSAIGRTRQAEAGRQGVRRARL